MARPRAGHELSIAQLEQILLDRRSKLGDLEKERAKVMKRLGALETEIAGLGGSSNRTRGGRVRNSSSLNETLVEVLKKSGSPMKVADIVDEVLHTGYKTNSANFRGIVNQTLIKDKRFSKGDVRGSYLLKK